MSDEYTPSFYLPAEMRLAQELAMRQSERSSAVRMSRGKAAQTAHWREASCEVASSRPYVDGYVPGGRFENSTLPSQGQDPWCPDSIVSWCLTPQLSLCWRLADSACLNRGVALFIQPRGRGPSPTLAQESNRMINYVYVE